VRADDGVLESLKHARVVVFGIGDIKSSPIGWEVGTTRGEDFVFWIE
jgi:hypothetical protein